MVKQLKPYQILLFLIRTAGACLCRAILISQVASTFVMAVVRPRRVPSSTCALLTDLPYTGSELSLEAAPILEVDLLSAIMTLLVSLRNPQNLQLCTSLRLVRSLCLSFLVDVDTVGWLVYLYYVHEYLTSCVLQCFRTSSSEGSSSLSSLAFKVSSLMP